MLSLAVQTAVMMLVPPVLHLVLLVDIHTVRNCDVQGPVLLFWMAKRKLCPQ